MIRSKTTPKELVIDLTGPQGNAFFLLANASKLAKQLGLNPFQVLEEMKKGDYENLIQVFDKYFGDYVVLER
tara:strand:+ start:1818 stop:2033 length:216 start_codon:yes stop_codon:yes gene_type:complete